MTVLPIWGPYKKNIDMGIFFFQGAVNHRGPQWEVLMGPLAVALSAYMVKPALGTSVESVPPASIS